jgi:alginate O-acetyltransferase complex protein AlgI
VLFTHPVFLFLFLPALLLLHAVMPRRTRNGLLLGASLLFYAWGEGLFVLVMAASIVGNFGFGRWIGGLNRRDAGRRTRRAALTLAVAFNLGLLFYFKYLGWAWNALASVAGSLGLVGIASEAPSIHLPLGISFLTFQALSYIFDVYRSDELPQRKLGPFALYLSLFPQLIAGPIVRYGSIARQLTQRTIGLHDVSEGARRFLQGLAKKVLIADVLAVPVDRVFELPGDQLSFGVAWVGLVGYTLQLYFDFSGYSDMAIGLGRMFGFRFDENFRHPYVARSITEFWRRWHISLSTWFRDYVYIPFGGNRHGQVRTLVNLTAVFLLCGLWHGAAWSFVVWGAFHGAFLVVERLSRGPWSSGAPRALQHGYVLLVVMAGWLVFRAPTLESAAVMAKALLGLTSVPLPLETVSTLVSSRVAIAFGVGVLFSMPLYPGWLRWRERLKGSAASRATAFGFDALELAALMGLFALAATSVAANTYSPFLYFRF